MPLYMVAPKCDNITVIGSFIQCHNCRLSGAVIIDRTTVQPRPRPKPAVTDVGLQPYVALVCRF